MTSIAGQCDCGNVKYECTQEPINSVFCYCTSCQQRTNSDKWFGLWIREAGFKFTSGKTKTFSRKGSSGKNMVHHFCENCGNTVAVFSEAGKFYTVSVTTMTDNNGLVPHMAIYTRSAPEWATFPEGVPKFDTIPASMGG